MGIMIMIMVTNTKTMAVKATHIVKIMEITIIGIKVDDTYAAETTMVVAVVETISTVDTIKIIKISNSMVGISNNISKINSSSLVISRINLVVEVPKAILATNGHRINPNNR